MDADKAEEVILTAQPYYHFGTDCLNTLASKRVAQIMRTGAYVHCSGGNKNVLQLHKVKIQFVQFPMADSLRCDDDVGVHQRREDLRGNTKKRQREG